MDKSAIGCYSVCKHKSGLSGDSVSGYIHKDSIQLATLQILQFALNAV